MTHTETQYILFDLDGTLLNTIPLIEKCFHFTLQNVPNAPSSDRIRSSIGLPLVSALQDFLTPLKTDTMREDEYEKIVANHLDIFRNFQLTCWKDDISVFDGIKETLRKLQSVGCRMAVVTSRNRFTTFTYLKHFDLLQFFPVVVTPENTSTHKPDPTPAYFALNALLDNTRDETNKQMEELGYEPKYFAKETIPQTVIQNTWFLGDTIADILCGKTGNMKTILCHWGPITEEQGNAKAEKETDYIAKTPSDVIATILHEE